MQYRAKTIIMEEDMFTRDEALELFRKYNKSNVSKLRNFSLIAA